MFHTISQGIHKNVKEKRVGKVVSVLRKREPVQHQSLLLCAWGDQVSFLGKRGCLLRCTATPSFPLENFQVIAAQSAV